MPKIAIALVLFRQKCAIFLKVLNQFKTGSKPVHPEISSLKHVHTLQKELCSIEWAALRGNLIAQGY